jgi:mRNA interferase MazF
VLAHQPKSFDWRLRDAKPRPWKKARKELLLVAGKTLNQIINICEA